MQPSTHLFPGGLGELIRSRQDGNAHFNSKENARTLILNVQRQVTSVTSEGGFNHLICFLYFTFYGFEGKTYEDGYLSFLIQMIKNCS